jgi:hypothetical protein
MSKMSKILRADPGRQSQAENLVSDGAKANAVLNGWKEIAAHFGVQVRTVQRWAKHHQLPVQRYPGEKGRVYVLQEALEHWRLDPDGTAAVASTLPPRRFNLRRSHWVGMGLVLLACVGIGYNLFSSAAPIPRGARVEGNDLVVTDGGKRDLFRHTFDIAPDVSAYEDGNRPLSITEDLDGDGSPEFLLIYHPAQRHIAPGRLICFSNKGKIKWEFTPGRRILFDDGKRSTHIYYVFSMRVLRSPNSPQKRILVASSNSPNWPCQVALLDKDGKILAEYWHPGHLRNMVIADLDGDGKEEALLVGVNNFFARATLVVLDPDRLHPISPKPDIAPSELKRGAKPQIEKKVLLFQKSCLSNRLQAFNWAAGLTVIPEEILVSVAEGVSLFDPSLIYHLNRDLSIKGITPSTGFLNRHRELEAAGKLNHTFLEQELQPLQKVTLLFGQAGQ